MPRRSRRRTPRRSNRKEASESRNNVKSWAINFVIGTLAVVVLGFVYSSINRIQENKQAVADLSLEESIQKYEKKSLAKELYEQKQFTDVWVEVLNGNGVAGVAGNFTDYLREQGFDVQNTDNASNFNYQNTQVIARSDEQRKAIAVAQALQIDTSQVKIQPDPSLQLDVTVILGKDYKDLSVYKSIQQSNIP
ncbi:MAG: LytR C-terminal domain-containing protein [Candidatus Marinimicrobia bacterium]|nr:LytR C-terminal domain-containing protein [Candidatus Neomarinimicrobiota bacterium]MCF7829192.1 LytR C-terminal domain-containing protein [Candidatus Neomarinimicrobiota bacterium]MCF7881155.1 LytR C-terminal domain-containing protein [Candidatus Neomarinimicrobiota bacterium]